MMWALEYNPDLFLSYENPETAIIVRTNGSSSKAKAKLKRQCGKYERQNLENAAKNSEAPLPISVFLVASVLKDNSSKLKHEARGLDDVVKVSYFFFLLIMTIHRIFKFMYVYDESLTILTPLQILNDTTGNLDAKKACTEALKLHKKYLRKVHFF